MPLLRTLSELREYWRAYLHSLTINTWTGSDWAFFLATTTVVCTAAWQLSQWSAIRLRRWHQRRILAVSLGGAELYTRDDIDNAMAFYVDPDCQSVDPVSDETEPIVSIRKPASETLDSLLAASSKHKYMILLADSGMGKTSFLLNYYARHVRRSRRNYSLALVPLNLPNSDEHLKRVNASPFANRTTLLIDGLDEDTRAIADIAGRIGALVEATANCRSVLLTSRTQFFIRAKDVPTETAIKKIGMIKAGESRLHAFQQLYLSPFDSKQVDVYIRRRFSIIRFKTRRAVRRIATKIPDLVARPMLLAYIEDFVQQTGEFKYSYQLFDALIDSWLQRERGFVNDKAALLRFCTEAAVDIFTNRERRGMERIPYDELEPLARRHSISLHAWQLRSRSLLNRDSVGNYKFAHRSIMEYLIIREILPSAEYSMSPMDGAPSQEPATILIKVKSDTEPDSQATVLAEVAGPEGLGEPCQITATVRFFGRSIRHELTEVMKLFLTECISERVCVVDSVTEEEWLDGV
jgi:hypothetical protein